jgi:glycerophosphoryl diester phosphodiesterase
MNTVRVFRAFGLLFCWLICGGVSVCTAQPQGPLVVAHRGLILDAPENTLANFRACLELRYGFEFDVARTKDGHLICIHDDTLDRTTNGSGKVADKTLAEIRKLDAGSWFSPQFAGEKVPTIEEVIQLIAEYRRHDMLFAVDLKRADAGAEVAQLAEKYQVLDKFLFIGATISSSNVRDQIKAGNEQAQCAALANNAEEFSAALAATNADWVYVRYVPTQAEANAVHHAKKRMFIAGVTVAGDKVENWEQAARVGMDGILTDYALKLGAALRKKSQGK